MHGKRTDIALRFILFLLILSLPTGVLSLLSIRYGTPVQQTQNTPSHQTFTVVLDAGHGGEDGGAVSASGLYEKDVNLAVARLLRDLLTANGVRVVMTRDEDILLYDKTVDYHGRKKALDLAARRKIGEETPNSIFVSIHMNAYPKPQYSGLQVWYSPNNAYSRMLAEAVQDNVKSELQPNNTRQVKAGTKSIYLLHHLTSPAILVECGFLSNPTEAEHLASEEYQRQLAFLIFASIMQAQIGVGRE